jgi:ribosomal protein S16
MENAMAKALMDFYHKILQPELQSIKEKQSEHDGKFIETLGHLDGVHKQMETLGQEYHSLCAGMQRLEQRQDQTGLTVEQIAADLKAHRADTEAHRGMYGVREE